MKNWVVKIKTNQKNCPLKYRPYMSKGRPMCRANDYSICTEKNCPFKEIK